MIRWNEKQILTGSKSPAGLSYFGASNKLNKKGDLIAIGATKEFSIYGTGGAVFVYSGSNSNWTLKKVASGFSGPSFENDQANFGQSVDFNENSNILAIGAPSTYNPSNTLRNGTVFIYTGDNFDLCSTLTGSRRLVGNNSASFFGQSLSLNSAGNILAVGASAQGIHKGYTYIFTGNQGIYKETQFLSGDKVSNDNFGYSVDLNGGGNILAVGASKENNFSGAVYIYTGDSSSNWTRVAKLTGTENNSEYFGTSVAFNSYGNVLAIGAPFSNINGEPCGAVYIYTGDSSSNWIQTARITGDRYSQFSYNDYFGYSVDLNDSGNILVIGAMNESVNIYDGNGIVYTFTGDSNNWYQTSRITGTDLDPGMLDLDRFGNSVSLNGSGDILAVGAPYSANNIGITNGAVYIFSGFTPYSQTINFSAIPTKTFGDSPFFLDATATSNLPVTFSGSNPSVATIVGSNVTIVGAGACEIAAYQIGNFDYSAATPVARTLTVLRGNQTINLPSFYTGIYNETKVYNASTPQGLPLIYTGNTNIFSISANNITFINTGVTILTGYNTGNLNYTGITGTQQVTVNRAEAIINFPYIPFLNKNRTTGYTLNVTSNHNESAIQYTSSNSGSIIITGGNVLAITGIGTGTISGYQPATSHYNEGFGQRSFTVLNLRSPQIVAVSNLPNNVFFDTGSKYLQGYLQDEGVYNIKVHLLEGEVSCEKTLRLTCYNPNKKYIYKVNYPINIGFIKYNPLERLGIVTNDIV